MSTPFGTEGRKVDNFIPATQQKYDYIVFRGSDVKDISIVEDQKPKEPEPSNIPNDPAILNSSRPGHPPGGQPQGPPQNRGQSPFPPPGYPPHNQQFGPGPGPGPGPGYYPPHQQFGRGFGPPPGAFGHGPGFPPYGPPPPGYFGPPGQGFPQGPGQFQQPPPPIGPPGQRNNAPNQPQPSPPSLAPPPSQGPQTTSELPVDIKAASKNPSKASTPVPTAPSAPESKPSVGQPPAAPLSMAAIAARPPPPQQKGGKVAPAMPFTVNQRSFVPPVPTDATNGVKTTSKPQQSKADIDEAQAKAREAVAAALAKVAQPPGPASAPVPTAAAVDALSKQVAEMGPSANGTQRGRGGFRGGRGGYPRAPSGGQQNRKIEIPKSDYDFESANAKFNKDDLIKEAIASGSPTIETPEEATNGSSEEPAGLQRKASIPINTGNAYNKSTSFFDNISSEAKEREEGDARGNARQQRGQEFSKNVETFGQGNVDGGYRGRGRGNYNRGGFGRGRQYGGNYRGYNRGYGGRGRGGQEGAVPPPTAT